MKVLYKEFAGEAIYFLPLSDTHIGDKFCDMRAVQGYIDWVKETPNAYVWLNGDIINVATTLSKSSVFEQDSDLNKQIKTAVDLLYPIKDKILGAITGNHEMRPEHLMGYNPTITICSDLGIPYLGYSALLHLKLKNGKGKRQHKENGEVVEYIIYAHHTTGGGGSVGSKLNRVDQLRQICPNADVYLGSHNHQLGVVPVITHLYNKRSRKVEPLRQMLVDTGSFLKWEGYAEAMQMVPAKLGAVRLRLNGLKKDIHASL